MKNFLGQYFENKFSMCDTDSLGTIMKRKVIMLFCITFIGIITIALFGIIAFYQSNNLPEIIINSEIGEGYSLSLIEDFRHYSKRLFNNFNNLPIKLHCFLGELKEKEIYYNTKG